MNHQPYPKYKESGVQWLGEVPEHWVVKAIKWESSVQRGASPRPIDDPVYFDDEGEYSWVRISDVTTAGMYLDKTEQKLSSQGSALSVKLQSGSLFLSIAGSVGKPCITNIKSCIHDGFVYFPRWKCDPRYLFYVFASGEPYKGLGKLGTQLNLNTDTVGSIIIGLPMCSEQTAIADFLDRETGRIDTLVAKNKKLIELLKEERSALISRTVTRGLPEDAAIEYGLEPHTRFKESGVEWLGEVPEGWEVWKLAHLTKRIGSGKTPTGGAEVYQNEGVIFLRSQNVYDDGLYLDDVVYIDQKIDEEMAWSRVQGQDILLNITGASLGRTCIVPNELPKSNVNQHVCVIRLNNTGSAEYISLYLKSKPAKAFYDFVQTGSAREGLNFQQIGAFPIPLPLLPEQQAIAAFLDRETAKIDKLIEKVDALITRLQEYRIAIITDAVTGKIDVREMAA